jgi:cytoskeletal protein RodZ
MAIGQKLEDARNRKGISIREASESTKIRGDFLTSFEAGNFDIKLPEVYLRGFIRVYARFLGIDPESAVADLNLEIGSGKNKNVKKSIGKIGGSESPDNSRDITAVDKPGTSRSQLPSADSSRKTLIFIGAGGTAIVLLSIILIIIFSSNNENTQQSDLENDPVETTIRETKLNAGNDAGTNLITEEITDQNANKESILKLAAIGPIERLIISDEGKSPKVFHEFKNVELGWEKSIPFSEGFRCYSSKLEHIRFAIDDGIEKQVNGQCAGNFSWSAK